MEFIWILIKTVFEIFLAIVKAFIKILPGLLEMKKYLSYMTPKGLFALELGVPVIVVSLAIWAGKFLYNKFVKQK